MKHHIDEFAKTLKFIWNISNEYSDDFTWAVVQTVVPAIVKQLEHFANQYPNECTIVDDPDRSYRLFVYGDNYEIFPREPINTKQAILEFIDNYYH